MPTQVTTVTVGSPGVGRVVGLVFLLIGLAVLGLAWHLTRQEQQFVAGAAEARGVVESLAQHTYQANRQTGSAAFGNTTSSYVPLVRFTDAQGHSHLFEATSSASRPAMYAAGEAVTVYYDPARPANAQLKSFSGQHLKPAFVWGGGLVFAGLGLVCLLLLGRPRS